MALSLRGSASGGKADGTDVSVSMPAGIAQDDVVYFCGGWASQTDDAPGTSTSGYTELAELYSNDNRDTNLSINRKVQGVTPDSTVVGIGSGSSLNGAAYAAHVWTGANTSTPEDATTTTATGIDSSIPNSPAIVTATANAVVLSIGASALGTNNEASVTSPTSYINQVLGASGAGPDRCFTVAIASIAVASPATENPSAWSDWIDALANSWCAATVAIRPAAAGNPTGNGALASGNSSVAGSGISKSSGNGALTSGNSSIAGSGRGAWLGSGSLVCQNASITGSGVSKSSGNGNLAVQSATIVGSGRSSSAGNGSLVAQNATVSGSGRSFSTGNGSLVSGNSSIIGSGVSKSSGNGNLVAQNAAIAGSGRSFSIGGGALVSGNSSISGSGSNSEEVAEAFAPFVYRRVQRMRAQKRRA